MKKRIYAAGIVVALAGLVTIWAAVAPPPRAMASASQSLAGHDHEHDKQSVSHQQEDPGQLSEKDHHEDHGHDEPSVAKRHDDHDGHGDDEEASSHAAHGHAEHGGEGGICPEHRVPEAEDALCHGDRLAELRPGDGMKVRLASPDVAAKAGIRLAEPFTISIVDGLGIPARVQFNRKRLARITPLATGIIQGVRVQPGDKVGKGDLLARITTPEIAALKAQLLTAQARHKQTEASYHREQDLLARGISSRQEFQQAEAEFLASQSASEQYRQQLLNYGLTPTDLEQLLRDGVSSAVLDLRAPFPGTVVEVNTAVGEAVEAGTPLVTLADLDALWLELAVPESRIYQAQFNAPIQARFDGLPGMVFTGKIFQAGAVVDERTRSLKVLAVVENRGHHLKVGMFGNARILEGSEHQVLAIPADALQSIDGASYVFIQKEADLFELRQVQAGALADGMIPILAGLSPGEHVVASQGFALKSEVLKARLGASCADH